MSDTTEVVIPPLGESVAEGTIATWHKQVGEAVTRDEAIVEVETDKASVEIVAGADGVLAEVLFAEGDDVAPGTVIAKIAPAGDTAPTPPAPAKEKAPEAKPETKPEAKPEAKPEPEAKPAPQATPKPETKPAPPPASKPAPQAPVVGTGGDLADKTDLDPAEITRDAVSGQVGVGDLTNFLHRHASQVAEEEAIPATPPIDGPAPTPASRVGDMALPQAAAGGLAAGAPTAGVPTAGGVQNSADKLSPAVERLVKENNLAEAVLQTAGTGPDGRLLKGDILALLASGAVQQATASAASNGAATPSLGFTAKREKMSRMRRTIARRLKEAQNTAALLTTYNEVDLGRVSHLRANYKDAIQERFGVRLGFMGFFLKATALALAEQPTVGAQIDGEEVVYPDGAHIAVAAATPKGLVTPVLRSVETMSLLEAEAALAALAGRARAGDLGEDDLAGGSFTISNGGVFGSLLSSPIVNPPQSAILGLHAIQDRPVAKAGKVVICPMMYLALSYDHRLIDGREAVTFLVRIRDLLQEPEALLLGLTPASADKK